MTKPDFLSSADLQAHMQQHNISGEILYLDSPTPTVEAAAKAVGAEPDQIVKSLLFFVNGDPVLAVASGTRPVERRVLARYYDVGRKRVKLASSDQVLEIVGYLVGTVPPFGHRQKIPSFLDHRVLNHNIVYAGGGAINALVRLESKTIKNAIDPEIIDLLALSE